MLIKSRRLFYVPEEHPDPVTATAAGLWFRDTRFLDPIRIEASPGLRAPKVIEKGPQRIVLDYGPVVATLVLDGALQVNVDVKAGRARLVFTADFRDIFELRGWTARNRGRVLEAVWDDTVRLGYEAKDGHLLRTLITVPQELEKVAVPGGVAVLLEGPGNYRAEVTPDDGGPVPPMPPRPEPAVVRTSDPDLNRLLSRSVADLRSLETDFPDGTLIAAGLPWYAAPFGRDVLITAWQTMHIDPAAAAATLRAMASLQGRTSDPTTGEQPGKIIHEARYGELARTGEVPHHPYYGTVDATPLFLVVAAEVIAWGSDGDLADDLDDAVTGALEWMETWGDSDGDLLLEYALAPDPASVPPLVARHQAWKDSDDSLHHANGTEPTGDIAPVEAQGYAHRALRSLAGLARARGDSGTAGELTARADELARRVNMAYWLETEGWYAQALDGQKRQVSAIASNGAQLLFSGLVPVERASRIAARMSLPDLWSGWGVRTLATGEPAYDPLSYHNGSVWPHDNGIIADGCYATGHADGGEAIFRAMIALAAASDGSMAELYSGETGDSPPRQVPGSCRPQAWAAGTLHQILRSALGLRAEGGSLVVSPALPSFLDQVEIEGLTALGKVGSLRVRREGSNYRVEAAGLPLQHVPVNL